MLIGGRCINRQIIGLTGYYCSGKSTVEKILYRDYDFYIIDVDLIGHTALQVKKDEVIKEFGLQILDSSGDKIDRKKLGKIVFKNSYKLQKLNSIVHPWMKEKVAKEIEEIKSEKICISAAILFEMGLDEFCTTILIVKAKLRDIIGRARKRDKLTILGTLRILKKQNLMKIYKKNKNNDDAIIVNNDADLLSLSKLLHSILNKD